jgi:hypothetical protein
MFKRSLIVAGVVGLALALGAQPRIVRAGDDCKYDGARFSDGALSCQAGKRYKCDDGEWKSKDERCTTAKSENTHERVIEKKTETDTEKSD